MLAIYRQNPTGRASHSPDGCVAKISQIRGFRADAVTFSTLGTERAHNANLNHRTDDSCALMYPSANSSHGCLNQAEAKALYNQANISSGDTCECIDLVTQGPNQTWSLNPNGTTCDDADVCSSASACNVGLCEATLAVDCDDSNPCTTDACDPVSGCSNPPVFNGAPCPDSDVCNGFEYCQSGACTPATPLVCDDGLYCNGAETCDSVTGCEAGVAPDPDDGVACTDDSCDEVNDTIVNAPDDAQCANGAYCDGDEICDAQTGCESGTPPTLDDGVACTDDSCDEIADLVVHAPNPALCDDADECTAESCDELLGCANDPIPECGLGVPGLSGPMAGALVALLAALGLIGRPDRDRPPAAGRRRSAQRSR